MLATHGRDIAVVSDCRPLRRKLLLILPVHAVNIPPPSWEGPANPLSLMWVQGIGVLAMAMLISEMLTQIVVVLLSLASRSRILDARLLGTASTNS